jgi:hypothetical protein
VLGSGQARAKKCFMAQATVPAARQALTATRIDLSEVKAIKTHNRFAVALPHGKSSFVRFKHLISSDSVPISPQDRNFAHQLWSTRRTWQS